MGLQVEAVESIDCVVMEVNYHEAVEKQCTRLGGLLAYGTR